MPSSEEYARERKAITGLVSRTSGVHPIALVTVARAEMTHQWPDLLHKLPTSDGGTFQNDDGTFPYLPGWDGPIESS